MKLTSEYMAATSKFGSDKRETIVAYVESYDDQRLWSNILQNELVINKKIKILYKVPSLDSEANGKSSLIKSFNDGSLVPGKNLIICIDSDFDYAFGCAQGSIKEKLYKNDYVFQTYVHSAENHYYTTNGLEHICEMACCSTLTLSFCIEKYTKSWSEIVFELYTKILFLRKISEHDKYRIYLEKINNVLETIYSGKLNVIKLDVLLVKTKKEITLLLEDIEKNHHFDVSYDDFIEELDNKNFNKHNINYLLRGHDLENKFLSNICVSLCNFMITNKKKEIYQSNVGPKAQQQINEYQNKVTDVINSIKQRTKFLGNNFFEKVYLEFKSMCEINFV
ncbi:DUF4435 domain-containing protein [Pseudoalteromonas sp. SR43-6]|uniref:DUF4435 domain-containing protein n=1 Tax=unclassified Pseudoalteromonas TaxID=194690 RepID=UPI0015F9A97A|nr:MULTISPECIES: DUF4435 domain-containing protein [unclassified Pseudoalteromonas]MBB1288835.1 DUF4435 domain-containing protein [Pseudoalteromonas sp. SR41-5]MBB1374752.1 DUF4435 domain-containing protein [Pseudoalteromonas sp. SR43-6]MBB1413866.1 DUF4435 domain-containing protein [Pseudoalteromonas sp. SG43-8]